MRPTDRGNANTIAAVFLVVLAVAIAGFIFFLRSQKVTSARVFLDNGTDQALTVEVDGNLADDLPAHSALEVGMEAGSRHLKLSSGDSMVADETVELPASQGVAEQKWVYNVQGRNVYLVRELAYGKSKAADPTAIGEGKTWFSLPSPSYVFLPAEAASTRGTAGTTVRTVGHAEVHQGQPCCKNLEALFSD